MPVAKLKNFMNTVSTRELFRSLCIALLVTLALATMARAEDKPAPADQRARRR